MYVVKIADEQLAAVVQLPGHARQPRHARRRRRAAESQHAGTPPTLTSLPL
jgi:hypothetical protein